MHTNIFINDFRHLMFIDLDPTKELNTPHVSAFKSGCTIPYGNRAVITHDITTQDLATIKNFYQDTSHAILLPPHVQQEQATALLKDHGYTLDAPYPLMTHNLANLHELVHNPHITIQEVKSLNDIEALWVPIFSEAYKKDPEQIKLFVRYLTSTPNAHNIHFFVAHWNGIPAACGIANIHGTTGALQCLGTVPALRNKGLGSAMMLHRLHAMKEKGVQKAIALASSMGKPLHEKLGFKEEATCTIYVATQTLSSLAQ